MSEKLTKREQEAFDLEAKAKAIRKAEKAFWTEVEERLEEVKKRFHLVESGSVTKESFKDATAQTAKIGSDETDDSLATSF